MKYGKYDMMNRIRKSNQKVPLPIGLLLLELLMLLFLVVIALGRTVGQIVFVVQRRALWQI